MYISSCVDEYFAMTLIDNCNFYYPRKMEPPSIKKNREKITGDSSYIGIPLPQLFIPYFIPKKYL